MKLYHYEHCPFCLRVRMILVWKGLQFEEEILANADEQRHYDLIGAKIVPILQLDDGSYIKESLDIVAYVDQNFGKPMLQDQIEDYQNSQLLNWLESLAEWARYLVHPRNVQIFSADFPSQLDRNYYEAKKSERVGSFELALAKSSEYISSVSSLLQELELFLSDIVDLKEKQPSYADILLFPVLRSLTHVKNLEFPVKIKKYLEKSSKETKISLLFDRAI